MVVNNVRGEMMKNKIIISTLLMFIVIDVVAIGIALSVSPVKLKRDVFTFQYGESIPVEVSYYVNAHTTIMESISLDLSDVSNQVGEYQASALYYNEKKDFIIRIEDTVKPKASLKNSMYKIQSGEMIIAEDLIKSVEDHSSTTVYFYNEETEEKRTDKIFDEIGSFVEKIIVEDEHGNCSAILRVKIIVQENKVAPLIYGIEDKTIKQYDPIDLLEGVSAMDDRDGNITDRIIVYGDVENGVKGQYSIIYSVVDSHGNEALAERIITVE